MARDRSGRAVRRVPGMCMIVGFSIGITTAVIAMKLSGDVFIRMLTFGRNHRASLTNPILDYPNLYRPDKDLGVVKYAVQDYINGRLSSGQARDIAVIVRDLANGPRIGINANHDFAPASLLKLPIMMAYFKLAEDDPAVLTRKHRFEDVRLNGAVQEIVPERHLELGKDYTVEELIRRMIVFSDNAAKNLLMVNLSEEALRTTFANVHLFIPDVITRDDYLSVEDYSSLFRILYNASYLSREMSEKALRLLSESSFSEGLAAGVPREIRVAHKFGEREGGRDGSVQLHDCGIVYYPGSPYLICIMTKGEEISVLKGIITDISRMVYEHKDKLCKEKDHAF